MRHLFHFFKNTTFDNTSQKCHSVIIEIDQQPTGFLAGVIPGFRIPRLDQSHKNRRPLINYNAITRSRSFRYVSVLNVMQCHFTLAPHRLPEISQVNARQERDVCPFFSKSIRIQRKVATDAFYADGSVEHRSLRFPKLGVEDSDSDRFGTRQSRRPVCMVCTSAPRSHGRLVATAENKADQPVDRALVVDAVE